MAPAHGLYLQNLLYTCLATFVLIISKHFMSSFLSLTAPCNDGNVDFTARGKKDTDMLELNA